MAGQKKRLLAFGSATTLIVTASLAFAVEGRGCVVRPFHGTALPFSSTASTLSVQVGGAINTNATGVTARVGRLSTVAGNLVAPISLGSLPVDAANDQFSSTVNVPRSIWPNDDVVGLEFTEVFNNGSSPQILDGAGVGRGNYKTKHRVIGVADQPDSIRFPEGKIDANTATPTVPFPNQRATTFLTRKGSLAAGQTYSSSLPLKLNAFFDSLDQIIAVAAYKNEGDLGFGRLMICAVNAIGSLWRYKCVVANYNSADEAAVGGTPQASVVMQYDTDGSVRFGAYNAAGDRVDKLALDGGGPKSLPHLCLNCHGGNAVPLSQTTVYVKTASFLPFDLDAFSLPSNVGDQSAVFRVLNRLVFLYEYNRSPSSSFPPNVPLMDILLKWYESSGGLFSDTSTFNGAAVPNGWSENPALYTTVVAPYCRSCHIAFPGNLAFASESDLFVPSIRSAIQGAVCNKNRAVMPHAQRAYHRFWASGARAALAVDLGIASCAFRTTFF